MPGLVSKRAMDLLLGVPLALLALPLVGAAALAVRLETPGPAFFRQTRLGLGGRPFPILKLRTMVDGAVHQGAGLLTHRDDPRITRVGRWLRLTRLDELPQLWNVLRGDMSLVGPRPLLPQFLADYTALDRRRLEVPPGMTGWQQVKGASRHSWGERVALDVWYVDHRSALLDLWILVLTAFVVLRGDGVYAADGSQLSGVPDRSAAGRGRPGTSSPTGPPP